MPYLRVLILCTETMSEIHLVEKDTIFLSKGRIRGMELNLTKKTRKCEHTMCGRHKVSIFTF